MPHPRLDDRIDELQRALEKHPERNIEAAEIAAQENRPRPYPAIYLNRPRLAAEAALPAAPAVPRTPEERLADEVAGMIAPLARLNPIRAQFGLGVGPGTIPACFGVELDAEKGHAVASTKTLDQFLAEGAPDPAKAGLMPALRERIERIRASAPPWIRIGLPDMQGPFNIAHAVLGNAALVDPYDRPEDFHRAMSLITDLYLAAHELLEAWIGPERLPPFRARRRIAECSVNLVSPDFYREFILPHDRRIAERWGSVAIHPCSGPHVFRETLQGLPNVSYTEAGRIPCASAGWISVEDALAEIGDRPILLGIGQEPPPGGEEEFIRRDLERVSGHRALLFGYTGMHWTPADEADMLALHRRLDEYYARRLA